MLSHLPPPKGPKDPPSAARPTSAAALGFGSPPVKPVSVFGGPPVGGLRPAAVGVGGRQPPRAPPPVQAVRPAPPTTHLAAAHPPPTAQRPAQEAPRPAGTMELRDMDDDDEGGGGSLTTTIDFVASAASSIFFRAKADVSAASRVLRPLAAAAPPVQAPAPADSYYLSALTPPESWDTAAPAAPLVSSVPAAVPAVLMPPAVTQTTTTPPFVSSMPLAAAPLPVWRQEVTRASPPIVAPSPVAAAAAAAVVAQAPPMRVVPPPTVPTPAAAVVIAPPILLPVVPPPIVPTPVPVVVQAPPTILPVVPQAPPIILPVVTPPVVPSPAAAPPPVVAAASVPSHATAVTPARRDQLTPARSTSRTRSLPRPPSAGGAARRPTTTNRSTTPRRGTASGESHTPRSSRFRLPPVRSQTPPRSHSTRHRPAASPHIPQKVSTASVQDSFRPQPFVLGSSGSGRNSPVTAPIKAVEATEVLPPIVTKAPVETTVTAVSVTADPTTVLASSLLLPEGWTEALDPASGRSYYYHALTGERAWERPVIPSTTTSTTPSAMDAAVAPEPETRQALISPQMEEENFVEVTTTADSIDPSSPMAALDSPVVPGTWTPVPSSDVPAFAPVVGMLPVEDVTPVMVEATAEETPILDVPSEQPKPTIVAAEPEAAESSSAAPPVSLLPEGWVEAVDPGSSRTYYYSVATGETTWERPAPVLSHAVEEEEEQEIALAEDSPYSENAIVEQSDVPVEDVVEETTPETLAVHSSKDPESEDANVQESEPTTLPDGWVEAFDEGSSRTYYCNQQTGETSWEIPYRAASEIPDQVTGTFVDDPVESSEGIVGSPSLEIAESHSSLGQTILFADDHLVSELASSSHEQYSHDETGNISQDAQGVKDQVPGALQQGDASDVGLSDDSERLPWGEDAIDVPVESAPVEILTSESPGDAVESTPPLASLPPGWTEEVDPTTDRVYYYSTTTGETRWEQPVALDVGDAVKASDETGISIYDMAAQAQNESLPEPTDQAPEEDEPPRTGNVPDGWSLEFHPDVGESYYRNLTTGEMSWDIPQQTGTYPPEIETNDEKKDASGRFAGDTDVRKEPAAPPVDILPTEDEYVDGDLVTNAVVVPDNECLDNETTIEPTEPQIVEDASAEYARDETETEEDGIADGLGALPPGWVVAVEPSNQQVYYYNEATGESSWERPFDSDVNTPSEMTTAPEQDEMDAIQDNTEESDVVNDVADMDTDWSGTSPTATLPQETTEPVNEQEEDAASNSLPENWQTVPEPDTGAVYYYNSVTGETSWEKPVLDSVDELPLESTNASNVQVEFPQDVPSYKEVEDNNASLPTGWVVETDPGSGKPFYYNESTEETSWDMPSTAPTPSSDQNTPELQESTSPHYLEEDNPEADEVVTGESGTTENPEANAPSDSVLDGEAEFEEVLPSGWVAVDDPDSGEQYYYNEVDGRRSWERPQSEGDEDFPVASDPDDLALSSDVVSEAVDNRIDAIPVSNTTAPVKETIISTESTIAPAVTDLPEGWAEAADPDSGEVYYFNDATGETRWEIPGFPHAVDNVGTESEEAPALGDDDPTEAEPTEAEDDFTLPDGWTKTETGEGEVYFYNEDTQETSWDVPVGPTSGIDPATSSLLLGTTQVAEEPAHLVIEPQGTHLPSRPFPSSCVAFGFGGRLCHIRGANIVIRRINEMAPNDVVSTLEQQKSSCGIQGPLAAAPSENVQSYISSRAGNSPDDLLWGLIDITARSKGRLRCKDGSTDSLGPLESIVQLLKADVGSSNGQLLQHSFTSPSNGTSKESSDEIFSKIEELMVQGRKEEAVEEAIRVGQLGLALFLSGMCSAELQRRVMVQFSEKEFVPGSPLCSVASLFCRSDERVSSLESIFGDDSDPLRQAWKNHLVALICNRLPDWDKATTALGNKLHDIGEASAAHFCYMVSGTGMGRPNRKSTRWTLAGCDIGPFDMALKTDESLLAFARTEGYEWAKRRANSRAIMKSLQPFKLVYCHLLADLGLVTAARDYLAILLPYFEEMGHVAVASNRTSPLPLAHSIMSGDKLGLLSNARALDARLNMKVVEWESDEVDGDLDLSFVTAHTSLDVTKQEKPKKERRQEKSKSKDTTRRKKSPTATTNMGPPVNVPPLEPQRKALDPAQPRQTLANGDVRPHEQPPQTGVSRLADISESKGMGDTPAAPFMSVPTFESANFSKPPITKAKTPPVARLQIPPVPTQKEDTKGSPDTPTTKAPSTPSRVAPGPVSAPPNLEQLSTPNSAQRRGMLGRFKDMMTKKLNPDATTADLGNSMEAYYDEDKKRWVFPGEDPAAEDPTAGPPPTTMELKESKPAAEEKPEARDPLSNLMAPPTRVPRGLPVRKSPNAGAKAAAAAPPPQFHVFLPKAADS